MVLPHLLLLFLYVHFSSLVYSSLDSLIFTSLHFTSLVFSSVPLLLLFSLPLCYSATFFLRVLYSEKCFCVSSVLLLVRFYIVFQLPYLVFTSDNGYAFTFGTHIGDVSQIVAREIIPKIPRDRVSIAAFHKNISGLPLRGFSSSSIRFV